MKHSLPTPQKNSVLIDQPRELAVSDIVKYLRRLARFQEDNVTGNVELSRGLKQLCNALGPFSDRQLIELSDALKAVSDNRQATDSFPAKAVVGLPSDLESLSHKDLESILANERHTKKQLVEVGFKRFGISRSRLDRLRKSEAKDSVRAALEHEKSLEAISRAARGMNKNPATSRRFSKVATAARSQEHKQGHAA